MGVLTLERPPPRLSPPAAWPIQISLLLISPTLDEATQMVPKPAADISEATFMRLAAAEADLAMLRRELEHTQRLAVVGTIAAGAAHEINNVLTPALAYAQLARSSPDDTHALNRALERTIAGIEAASGILQGMLDFSSVADESACADINAAVQAALDCMGRDPGKDGIHLKRRIPPATAAAIQPLALQQVILNLILNARRALASHKARDRQIMIIAKPQGDGLILITFTDNGPGIPPEVADSLFEPFVSCAPGPELDQSGSGDCRGGTGLGLAVCRRAIEAAGGSIAAGSHSSGGAKFTINLPAADPVHAA